MQTDAQERVPGPPHNLVTFPHSVQSGLRIDIPVGLSKGSSYDIMLGK